MKKSIVLLSCCAFIFCFSNCQQKVKSEVAVKKQTINENSISFESQIKWGEHLVTILDCQACHTPKKMTSQGMVFDETLMLSGRPSEMPALDIDRQELESKGLTATGDLTEWAGPWGVSYAANLTPDETGIGNWTEEQFILSLREGKYKGLAGSRTLLPPMPWESFSQMTDDEIKAIFAYLKSIKPIKNLVPDVLPPASAVE
jgi:hypothetical protein